MRIVRIRTCTAVTMLGVAIISSTAIAQSTSQDRLHRHSGARIGGGIEGSIGAAGMLRIGYQINRVVGVYREGVGGFIIPMGAFAAFGAVAQVNITPGWYLVGGGGVFAYFPRTTIVGSARPCFPDPNACLPPLVTWSPTTLVRVEISIRDAQRRSYGAISIAVDGRFVFAFDRNRPVFPMPALTVGYETY